MNCLEEVFLYRFQFTFMSFDSYDLSLDMSCRFLKLIRAVTWYELSLFQIGISCRLIWVVAWFEFSPYGNWHPPNWTDFKRVEEPFVGYLLFKSLVESERHGKGCWAQTGVAQNEDSTKHRNWLSPLFRRWPRVKTCFKKTQMIATLETKLFYRHFNNQTKMNLPEQKWF